MVAEPGRFDVHSTRRSSGKKAGAIAALSVLAVVGGVVGFAFLAAEPKIVEHVIARDALGPVAAYVLGLRVPKAPATRKALVEALEAVSGDKPASPQLRAAAAYAIGAAPPEHDATVTLAESSERDPEPIVRAAALKSLGRSGDSSLATAPIRLGLDDQDKRVRLGACEGAGFLKDRALLRRLVEMVSDNDYDVRVYATRALQAITGETIGVDNNGWRDWFEKHG